MLVTESFCWRRFHLCWYFLLFIKSVNNIQQLSAIYFVSNIRHQHRCRPKFWHVIPSNFYWLNFEIQNVNFHYKIFCFANLIFDQTSQKNHMDEIFSERHLIYWPSWTKILHFRRYLLKNFDIESQFHHMNLNSDIFELKLDINQSFFDKILDL